MFKKLNQLISLSVVWLNNMGCDCINAGEIWFGYVISFEEVFCNTKYENMRDVEEEAEEDASVQENIENENAYCENYEICRSYCATMGINSAWYHYLEKYHHDLLKFKVHIFIGCHGAAGAYNVDLKTEDCSVVFGFRESEFASQKKHGSVCYSTAFEFPENMPKVVNGFLAHFKLPKKSSSVMKTEVVVDEINLCPVKPKMLCFVSR